MSSEPTPTPVPAPLDLLAVLFGRPRDLDLWNVRLRRGHALIECWCLDDPPEEGQGGVGLEGRENLILPLVIQRGKRTTPVYRRMDCRKGDQVHFAILAERPQLATGRRFRRPGRMGPPGAGQRLDQSVPASCLRDEGGGPPGRAA